MGRIDLLISCILKDMTEPVGYLPFGLIFGILYLTFLHIKRNRKLSSESRKVLPHPVLWKDFLHFLLIVYGGVLLKLAFLSREPGSRTGVSLIPFETWGNTEIAHAFFIENILMFIPLGILLPLVSERFRKPSACIVTGLLCSLFLELLQLATGRGFCQLDDLMTNTAGTALGFAVFLAAHHLRKKFSAKA